MGNPYTALRGEKQLLHVLTKNVLRDEHTLVQAAILLPLLIVVAVIQVLPQVDLPDTAFRSDTATIVAKSWAFGAAAFSIAVWQDLVASVHQTILAASQVRRCPIFRIMPIQPLPILFSAILC